MERNGSEPRALYALRGLLFYDWGITPLALNPSLPHLSTRNYQAKLKLFPSGKGSLIYRYPNPPCQSCQTSAESPKADEKVSTTSCDIVDALPSGHGGLGSKSSMSWKSARQLKERMAAVELEYERKNCWFLTLTQPSVDNRAFEGLARWSSYAVDRLNRQMKRYFNGAEFVRCSVWEYQKRGSLHLHLLIASECIHAKDINEFRRVIADGWYRILGDISKRFYCLPFRGSHGGDRSLGELMDINGGQHFVNCQTVKKSVVAYLSAYLSESGDKKEFNKKQRLRQRFFPIATWSQWDRKATELYEKYYEEIDLGLCPNINIHHIDDALDRIKNELPIKKDTDYRYPVNPYNNGIYFLFDRQVNGRTAAIREVIETNLLYLFEPPAPPPRD